LPEPLSQAAVELAREHGVYPVAHPLRLDYVGLKKRLGGIPVSARKATRTAFVELTAPPAMAQHDEIGLGSRCSLRVSEARCIINHVESSVRSVTRLCD
jgi:hypothetical protein